MKSKKKIPTYLLENYRFYMVKYRKSLWKRFFNLFATYLAVVIISMIVLTVILYSSEMINMLFVQAMSLGGFIIALLMATVTVLSKYQDEKIKRFRTLSFLVDKRLLRKARALRIKRLTRTAWSRQMYQNGLVKVEKIRL